MAGTKMPAKVTAPLAVSARTGAAEKTKATAARKTVKASQQTLETRHDIPAPIPESSSPKRISPTPALLPTLTPAALLAVPTNFGRHVLGVDFYPWQKEILSWFSDMYGRVKASVAAPNGSGKSERVVACLGLWWMCMCPKATVVITSKDSRQLDEQIWPAIEQHKAKFQGFVWNRRYIESPTGGRIIGFTTNEPGRAEGWHRQPEGPLLIIVDEAKSVPEAVIPGPVSPPNRSQSSMSPKATDIRFASQHDMFTELGKQWQELAHDEKTGSLGPTPTDTDWHSIFRKLDPQAAGDVTITNLPEGKGFRFSDSAGYIDLKRDNDGKYFHDSQNAGNESRLIFQAIYAWAHNNGFVIKEDPGGLTPDGIARRPSQMLSSALRFGTTRHMEPGPYSLLPWWKIGDSPDATAYNIGVLAMHEADTVDARLDKLKGLRYDIPTQSFYDGRRKIPDADIQGYLSARINSVDPEYAERIGHSTLRRALVTRATQGAIKSGFPARLVVDAAEAPAALSEIRYTQEQHSPFGSRTASAKNSKLEAIRAELLGQNRPTPQRAIDWMRMFKAIAPGPARQLDLQILSRLEASRKMAAIEASLTGRSVVHGVPPDAHAAIHRDTIYLFQEALGEYRRNGNELTEGIRRVQHEVYHKWWDALSQNERAALANDAWAQKRASIAAQDGTLVGRAAARLRGWLFEARQTIAPSLSHDVIANELRNVLRRGMGKTEPSPSAFARRRYSPNSQDVRSDTAQREINANLQALQTDRETILKEIAAATVQGYSTDDLQVFQDWLIQLDQKIQELSPTKDTKSPQKEHELPQVGKSFNSQRHKIPKAGGNIVPILLRAPSEKWVDRVTDWLDAIKKVDDPKGRRVLLANPEAGSLKNRALHLVGSYKKNDIYKQGKRELRAEKAKSVFAIPKTIEDYQILAEDNNHGLAYFRRYADGTIHMVIVEKSTGTLQDHELITQREISMKDGAKNFTIIDVREATE